MNIFSWNVTLDGNKKIDLDFDYIESLSKSWNKIVFVFWETNLKSHWELLDMLKESLGPIIGHDISISSENKIDILNWTYEEWIYEIATFEWEEVTFEEIVDRFKDFEEVVSIREADISEKFGNKKIKVDFVY